MEAVQHNPVSELSEAIRNLIARMERSPSNELWDAGDIAIYIRLSKKTVQNHLLEKPGFPRPVVLSPGGRRWVASEVKEWVLRHR